MRAQSRKAATIRENDGGISADDARGRRKFCSEHILTDHPYPSAAANGDKER